MRAGLQSILAIHDNQLAGLQAGIGPFDPFELLRDEVPDDD